MTQLAVAKMTESEARKLLQLLISTLCQLSQQKPTGQPKLADRAVAKSLSGGVHCQFQQPITSTALLIQEGRVCEIHYLIFNEGYYLGLLGSHLIFWGKPEDQSKDLGLNVESGVFFRASFSQTSQIIEL